MLGSLYLILGFLVSMGICFLIARFSPNLWWVLVAILLLQVGGFVGLVEKGEFFNNYTFLNMIIVACLTFIWFLITAQMHLTLKSALQRRGLS